MDREWIQNHLFKELGNEFANLVDELMEEIYKKQDKHLCQIAHKKIWNRISIERYLY
jgi:hypothetical protein